MLDNWYFGRPVNQRGQTEYAGNATYSIDRWWTQYETPLSVVDGGIKIGGKWDVQQYFENTLPNVTYTLSLLYKDRTGSDPLRLLTGNRTDGDIAQTESKDASGILSVTFSAATANRFNFGFTGSTDNSAIIIAIKLELGDTQTLAHKENGVWVLNEIPDFGEQLRRCQRYCRPIPHRLDVCSVNGTYYAYTLQSFEEMRSTPVSLTNLIGKNVKNMTDNNVATIANVYTWNKYGGVAIQLSQNPNTDILFLDSMNYLISADLYMQIPKSRVYVQTDETGRVLRLEGEYSLPTDLAGWTKIDEGYGDRFSLAQSHYLDKPLYDGAVLRYKLVDGKVVERTAEEIEADKAKLPKPAPTTTERVTSLEEQLATADETAISLYEAQQKQDEINAQQDDALLEIYELIGK